MLCFFIIAVTGVALDPRLSEPKVLFTEAVHERLAPESQRASVFLGTVTVKGKTEAIRLWGAADEM